MTGYGIENIPMSHVKSMGAGVEYIVFSNLKFFTKPQWNDLVQKIVMIATYINDFGVVFVDHL